jgi:vacuolar iron transporter family protein
MASHHNSTLTPLLPATERPQDHKEQHASYHNIIRDTIIGFADGLTVPFALCAGLSSLGNTRLVIMGGLAELFSGAISMGLGAYLAACTERERYASEEARERDEVRRKPDAERREIVDVLAGYGVSGRAAAAVAEELARDEESWVRFMMDFELRLEKPPGSRAWVSAATMGLSYFVGGLIPMLPYFGMKNATEALFVSVAITVVILLAFGYVKTVVTVGKKTAGFWGALHTLVIGLLAAGTSYGIVRAIDGKSQSTSMAWT